MRPYIIIHPAWELMGVLWWNLLLTSVTPQMYHSYIDVFLGQMLRGPHADV
jgi:hypothetical protein